MKNLKKHIGLLVVVMIAYTGSVYAQFDDVYFDPSRDQYSASTSLASNSDRNNRTTVRSADDQSYNYMQDGERPRMDDGQYSYDDDEYDYYNEDYAVGNHYFDDYAYTRRINRFHRNRFFYDPFMYDDFYMMSGMYGRHSFYNPYMYSRFYSPFYRPGLYLSFGFGSPFGYGYPMYYGNRYGRFYNPYSYGFYDPIMAYNYGYGHGYGYGYNGYYGYGYPYVYRNHVNPYERPVYYNGARTSGGAGVVPTARDGRIQVRSNGGNDGYVAPSTRTSPRGEDRSNRAVGNTNDDQRQNVSPRSSGSDQRATSPRSNTYTPREGSTNRVYQTPSRVERRSAGDRSTYTPRSTSPRTNYRPSSDSPRRSYTPSRSSERTYTPSSRNSTRSYTPSSRSSDSRSSINRSTPSQRSYTPSSRSSSSSSRSSGTTPSSSRRSSPR